MDQWQFVGKLNSVLSHSMFFHLTVTTRSTQSFCLLCFAFLSALEGNSRSESQMNRMRSHKNVSMICFWRNIVVSCNSGHSFSYSSGTTILIYCTTPHTVISVNTAVELLSRDTALIHNHKSTLFACVLKPCPSNSAWLLNWVIFCANTVKTHKVYI